MKIKYLDLFCGCGGLSEGFEQTGKFKLVAAVEWDKKARDSFANRLKYGWNYIDADERILHFDIQKTRSLFNGWKNIEGYAPSKGLDRLVNDAKGIDLIIGGPPCQAYSIAGRVRDKNGMQDDYRNFLFESYIKVVKRYNPKMFIFENVPGILSATPGGINILDRIKASFKKAGYILSNNIKENALFDLSEFGVPQNRKRIILVGVRKELFKNESEYYLKDFYSSFIGKYKSVKNKKSVKEAIGDLKPFYPKQDVYLVNGKKFSHMPSEDTYQGHIPRFHNERDIDIFKELAKDIETGENKYIKSDELKKLYTARTGRVSSVHKYYVLRWDEPSNTIPAHLYKDGLRHIHPDSQQARSITVREAARLQTFPDDFIFKGSAGDQYKMIGNAVPPLFAKIIANALYKFWSQNIKPERVKKHALL